ncbi:MAG: DNA gyrase subunit A, partial [Clostridia bacterium]|nr:DNA gyrase subunit A [Clostridia bacterium]
MRLQRLTGLEVEKINEELGFLTDQNAYFNLVLSNDEEVKKIIIKEITEIKEKYATPRLSELTYDYGDIDIEDLIEKEDVVISMTHGGYIKRMPVAEYKAQHRGGVGITAHKAKDEDFVEKIFTCNTHERIMFFTNFGKVFTLKAYEIPEAARTARGRAAVNLLQLEPGEKIQSFMWAPEDKAGLFLMLATKKGLIKKTPLEEFDSIKRNGKIAIKFNEEDELIDAMITSGNDECLIASSEGMCIHFNEKDVRPVGRTAMGVKAMNLGKGATLVALAIVKPGSEILTVTHNGYGKRTAIEEYPLQGRAGKGVKAGVFNEKTGNVVSLRVLPEDMDIMMITDNGIIIRVEADEISRIGRATQGVRIMKLKDDNVKVMATALTPHVDEEELEEGVEEGAEGGEQEATAPTEE